MLKKLILLLVISQLSYSQILTNQRYLDNQSQKIVDAYAVSISGTTIKSGTYFLPNSARILDVIKVASDTFDIAKSGYRQVKVTEKDSSFNIDLLKYITKGDETQNPFIKMGTKVFVDFATQFVTIKGDIMTISNTLPIKQNEAIKDMLNFCTFTPTSDSLTITLIRDRQYTKYSIQQCSSILLMHGDCILVNSTKSAQKPFVVLVKGEVVATGLFPIDSGKTYARDLILSIGILPQGDSTRAFILRKSKEQFIFPQTDIRPEITAGMKSMLVSNDYLCIPSLNMTLMDGDEIIVPKKDSYVYMSGYVKNPGAYTYETDKDFNYYIEKAGGFSKSADHVNVRIMTTYGNFYQIKEHGKIFAGDVILVPENTEFKYLREWAPIIQIIGSTITIVATLIGVFK